MSAAIATPIRTVELHVGGMTCAGCAGRVERALSAVPEVGHASVNLASERVHVQLLAAISDDTLIAIVAKAGYGASLPRDPLADQDLAQRRLRSERLTVFAALILALPLALPMLVQPFGLHGMLPAWAQLLLATPVQFILGARFYKAAWSGLRARSGNMDQLVALGTSAGFGLSLYLWWQAEPGVMPHLYFEASAVVIALVLLGKHLESRAKRQTASAIRALEALRPERAVRLKNGVEQDVAISQLRVGDQVLVKPGERFPVDGEVLEGRSHADEALISGESLPVPKQPGDKVTGGAINGEGCLLVSTRALGTETVLARIIRLVEDAQAAKAPIQTLVDRVSQVFVPTVLIIASATLFGWWLAGASFESALINAVAVLVIACPCALGLATPAAIMAGTGVAAGQGILIKDTEVLERAHGIRQVVFDKTGTLTSGSPRVVHSQAITVTPEDLLRFAGALQRGSEHPLARAVLDAAAEQRLQIPQVSASESLPGRGIAGSVDGRTLALGNRRMLDESGLASDRSTPQAQTWEAEGRTLSWLIERAPTPQVLGLFAFGDTIRPGAAQAINTLRAQGFRSHLLTGDNRGSADVVARMLGIDAMNAEVLPGEKAATVIALKKQGAVAMVGDGINDAPALAAADIGIAMGGGTDVAMQAAGITLMRSDPRLVPAALQICRKTYAKIRQNLFWAFIYNLIGIPLAAFGYLNPVLAGAAMALSSVSVVANALWLKTWKPREETP